MSSYYNEDPVVYRHSGPAATDGAGAYCFLLPELAKVGNPLPALESPSGPGSLWPSPSRR